MFLCCLIVPIMQLFLFAQDLEHQDGILTVNDWYGVSIIFADAALLEAVKFGIRYILEQRFPDSQANRQSKKKLDTVLCQCNGLPTRTPTSAPAASTM